MMVKSLHDMDSYMDRRWSGPAFSCNEWSCTSKKRRGDSFTLCIAKHINVTVSIHCMGRHDQAGWSRWPSTKASCSAHSPGKRPPKTIEPSNSGLPEKPTRLKSAIFTEIHPFRSDNSFFDLISLSKLTMRKKQAKKRQAFFDDCLQLPGHQAL